MSSLSSILYTTLLLVRRHPSPKVDLHNQFDYDPHLSRAFLNPDLLTHHAHVDARELTHEAEFECRTHAPSYCEVQSGKT